jgi:2-polyprenyl-3-methyl-5-hydroxy-6-metoxy-1,4-benzoquinol methylase
MEEGSLVDLKPYYRNPREDVLPFVPDKVSRLLDVGCGAGAFGAMMKEKRGCEAWGVEAVERVAAHAMRRLDRVFSTPIEEALPKLEGQAFDLITFLDVLEHTVEPGQVLAGVKPLLAKGGLVLASLPNLRYWDTFRSLVWRGEFSYADFGILDRTHLRFYTQKSIPELFDAAGYRIESITGMNPTPSRQLKLVNLATGGRFRDCQYLQFAILARPV